MRGRTPTEAVGNYVDSTQLAISCISDWVVTVDGGYYPSDMPHILTMNRESPVRLSGESRLWFLLIQYYRIIRSDTSDTLWTVTVTGYRYAVIDTNGRDVLEYHWHPVSRSPITSPHLHIGHGAMVRRTELRDAHLPTGHVSISEILRTLIRDFAVIPQRRDWESILDATAGQ